MVVVVFPTPPFWFAIAIMRAIARTIPQIERTPNENARFNNVSRETSAVKHLCYLTIASTTRHIGLIELFHVKHMMQIRHTGLFKVLWLE